MGKARAGRPPAGPFEAWAFHTTLLREGDILLCTDPESWVSSAIIAICGGHFSHAAICTLRPLFIEANDHGVTEISLERYGLLRRDCGRILRLRQDVPDAAKIAMLAAKGAHAHQTKRYDTIAAMISVLPLLEVKPKSSAFCSHLVAAAFKAAGLDIAKDKKGNPKPPNRVTPADIENSPYFDNITDQVLGKSIINSKYGPFFFVDVTDDKPSSAQEYNIQLRAITNELAELPGIRGVLTLNTFDEACFPLVRDREQPWFRAYDAFFARLLKAKAELVLVDAAAANTVTCSSVEAMYAEEVPNFDEASLLLNLHHTVDRLRRRQAMMQETAAVMMGKKVFADEGGLALGELVRHDRYRLFGMQENIESDRRISRLMIERGSRMGWPVDEVLEAAEADPIVVDPEVAKTIEMLREQIRNKD